MDGDFDGEDVVIRMCAGAALSVMVIIFTFLRRLERRHRSIRSGPSDELLRQEKTRAALMSRIYHGYSDSCQNFVRMRSGAFMKLAKLMRKKHLLKDSMHITVEEQLSITLNILGHKSKNRTMRTQFIRSGETVSRYFNRVLQAISCIQGKYMKQAPNEVPQEILSNPSFYPFFKDCIGMIDGTHVDAMLPASLVVRFRGRKCVTQNILAACTPNKLFTYVLAGWEGSANDYRILQEALFRLKPYGLRVYTCNKLDNENKYYLCDAGYTTQPGFISPYRGVRYHLKEFMGRTPQNRRELFNLRHSSLRSKIKATFGILKSRFKILTAKPHYPFPVQVDIVLACTVLHNYIATVDPDDELLNESFDFEEEALAEEINEEANVMDFTQSQSVREQNASKDEWRSRRDQIALDMWTDYCHRYRHGDTSESAM
ncbi:uncharacterized protein LOC109829844 [Asparagus officinalis]|uniref:uncharacterized protein LOC109829844 n=1 Tax=Asparagus officinalis TaxID=4686 RepID=UPI00098E0A0F|nr:uncharacterized protein LOC109829844 [Asparagus officinalis]